MNRIKFKNYLVFYIMIDDMYWNFYFESVDVFFNYNSVKNL